MQNCNGISFLSVEYAASFEQYCKLLQRYLQGCKVYRWEMNNRGREEKQTTDRGQNEKKSK